MRYAIQKAQTWQSGTRASEFTPPFTPADGEMVIRKTGSSAFTGADLDEYLKSQHISELYFMGFALHVCVESSIRSAHDLGYNASVITDAVAAFTQEQPLYCVNQILPHFAGAVQTADILGSTSTSNSRGDLQSQKAHE